jgi:hypothetical protein
MIYKRFKEGELIYSNHDDEYAVFLNNAGYDGWITVLKSDGEKCQVQGCWWKVVSCK